MSMIFFACVVRVRDGLPLSASTDFHLSQDFLECRKRLKALSLILTQYPSRGTARGRDLSIHFLSSGEIASMVICSSSYSTIMAFCFLEELQWEFAAAYDTTSIDNIIQKVKYHFNYTGCSQMKISLEKIQEELKFRPPVLLKLEDMELMNGLTNGGHTQLYMGSVASQNSAWRENTSSRDLSGLEILWTSTNTFSTVPTYRMQPVTAIGILSLILNIMCGALNLIRGVHLAEYSFQEDHEGIGNVIAFFLPFLACIFQCYLYLFYSSGRKMMVFVLFFSICLCNMYLYGLRNIWQILFHIGVASLSSYQILTRQLVEKQPDPGV